VSRGALKKGKLLYAKAPERRRRSEVRLTRRRSAISLLLTTGRCRALASRCCAASSF